MAQRFDFWTHGIATVIQSRSLAKRLLRRTDLGTVVSQNPNTAGWFHIPITTPTVMTGDTTIYLRRVGLIAKVNQDAVVDRIHIRRGTDLIFNQAVNYKDTDIKTVFDVVPDQKMGDMPEAGLAMSIHVSFYGMTAGKATGEVQFHGAGAHFS